MHDYTLVISPALATFGLDRLSPGLAVKLDGRFAEPE
jgi:hypothetical protein